MFRILALIIGGFYSALEQGRILFNKLGGVRMITFNVNSITLDGGAIGLIIVISCLMWLNTRK